jgi:hypothetical protein
MTTVDKNFRSLSKKSIALPLRKANQMLSVAKNAIGVRFFAFAAKVAAPQKEQAFQASSPKTSSRPSGRLFFDLNVSVIFAACRSVVSTPARFVRENREN